MILGIDVGRSAGQNRRPPDGAPLPLRPNFATWLARSQTTVVLCVSGEVDLFTAPWFSDAIRAAYATGLNVVVDLADVEFIDCAALHVLADAAESRPPHKRLSVTQSSPQVQRLLELTGIVELVRIVGRPAHAAA